MSKIYLKYKNQFSNSILTTKSFTYFFLGLNGRIEERKGKVMEWLSSCWQLVLLLIYITAGFRWLVGRIDNLSSRINEVEKDVVTLKMDVSMIKGMLSGTKFRTDP